MYVPRFRARAKKQGRSWGWELFITIGPDNEENESIHMTSKDDRFINKAAALGALQKILPDIIKETCKAMGLPMPEALHDLKAGTLESIEDWEKKGIGNV